MNEKIERALSAYLQLRKLEGLAPSTLEGYRYHVTDYSKRIPNGTDNFRAAVMDYFGQADINNNTFNYRKKYLKCFFDWAMSEKFLTCEEHPMRGIKARKPISRIINIDNETIAALLELPDRSTFSGLRDYALLLFSVDCGARPNESLQLRADDFNFSQCTARIRPAIAKTRTERTVPISEQTADAVKKLISSHHAQWSDAPIFCTSCGKTMKGTSWGHILKRYSKKIGADISPYALRHICALGLLRQGMNVFCVQKMLGHSDISMTQRYLALNLDDLKEQHSRASLLHAVAPKVYRVGKIA